MNRWMQRHLHTRLGQSFTSTNGRVSVYLSAASPKTLSTQVPKSVACLAPINGSPSSAAAPTNERSGLPRSKQSLWRNHGSGAEGGFSSSPIYGKDKARDWLQYLIFPRLSPSIPARCGRSGKARIDLSLCLRLPDEVNRLRTNQKDKNKKTNVYPHAFIHPHPESNPVQPASMTS